jgi:hypothetical protein
MHFFRHTFQNLLCIIIETLLEGVTLGCAQAHTAHPAYGQYVANLYAAYGVSALD